MKTTPLTEENDSFLKWYKNEYGTNYTGAFNRKEGMSDKDFSEGTEYYQAFLKKNKFKNQYDNAANALDKSKSEQRAEADVVRQKMAKYLDEYSKITGMDNLGINQAVQGQAYIDYMNNLTDIENNINTQKTDLYSQYLDNVNDADSTAAENIETNSKYYQNKEEEKLENTQATNFSDIDSLYRDNTIDNETKLKTLENLFSTADLSEEQKKIIESYMSSLASLVEDEKAQKQQDIEDEEYNSVRTKGFKYKKGTFQLFGANNFDATDDFYIEDENGNEYKVESAGEVDDAELKKKAMSLPDGTVFAYQDKIYILSQGKTFLIVPHNRIFSDHRADYSKLYEAFNKK